MSITLWEVKVHKPGLSMITTMLFIGDIMYMFTVILVSLYQLSLPGPRWDVKQVEEWRHKHRVTHVL